MPVSSWSLGFDFSTWQQARGDYILKMCVCVDKEVNIRQGWKEQLTAELMNADRVDAHLKT